MKKIIQLLALAIILVAGTISCKKDAFDINKNPNQVTDSTVTYQVILPAALNNTARVVARNWGWLQNYLGYWARSGTYAPNTAEETYELTTNFQSQIWTNIYDNLYDYQSMQIASSKAGANFYTGISMIMKAHNYALLVDLYNNVPYSEALKGAANITPRYDNGVDIYKDLLMQIDSAVKLIRGADVASTGPNKGIATNDIMFFGDATKWAKFGNTLRLRLLVHLMNGGVEANPAGTVGTPDEYVPGISITQHIDSITRDGSGFLGAGESAEVQPGYKSDKGNPFYNLYVTDNAGAATQNSVYYKANEYAIGYYGYNGDPREGRFYTASPTGFRGVPYGLPSETAYAAATLSGIGPALTGPTGGARAAWIILATESMLLQAEAMHRGFLPGSAGAMVNAAITESFVYTGVPSATTAAATYIANNATYADVDYNAPSRFGGAPGGLFTIISQKWFGLNGFTPYEVWTDYRRVDYSATINHFVYGAAVGYAAGPPISVSPANTKTEIPVRLFYPQAEYLYNPANVGAQAPLGAYPYSHIFWDLN